MPDAFAAAGRKLKEQNAEAKRATNAALARQAPERQRHERREASRARELDQALPEYALS